MVEPAKSLPEPPRAVPSFIEQLAELQSTLTKFLDTIDDDAQTLDANSENGHNQVEQIRRIIKDSVFGVDGPLKPSDFKELYQAYKVAREAEYDQYNIYSRTLERYKKRRATNLSTAEVDKDTQTLVERRRKYIPKLVAFSAYVEAILDALSGESSST